MDPTLVLRLLRVANSSYYGLNEKVESISRALVFIGMRDLRNMIVTEALKDIFKQSGEDGVFSKRVLWLHSSAVSTCGQMIAERIFGIKSEDVFLCGILHDIGMIVEDQVEHELFLTVCREFDPKIMTLNDHEEALIGTDHCFLGFLLAKEWQLPVPVQEGIKFHHHMLTNVTPDSITGIIQMAEYLVTRMKYPAMAGMPARLSPPLVAHIKKNMGEYKVLAKELPGELAKAKELYESEDDTV